MPSAYPYGDGITAGNGNTSGGCCGFCSRLPFRVVLLWSIAVLICYSFFSQPDVVPTVHIPHTKMVDAVVFIAMGLMSNDPMVDFSIGSVRKLGRWKGPIYVITDHPDCFAEAVLEYSVSTVQVPPANSILEIKALKPQLMHLLPVTVRGALYLDVDILVTRDLSSFFRDLGSMIYTRQVEQNRINPPNATDTFAIEPAFDFAGPFPPHPTAVCATVLVVACFIVINCIFLVSV